MKMGDDGNTRRPSVYVSHQFPRRDRSRGLGVAGCCRTSCAAPARVLSRAETVHDRIGSSGVTRLPVPDIVGAAWNHVGEAAETEALDEMTKRGMFRTGRITNGRNKNERSP